jgi:hypothetical protein
MNFLIAELKKKATTKTNKLLYLRMLIHIVEDVHQPLHTGHLSDKGGNDVKVQWFGKESNLHSIWDSATDRCTAIKLYRICKHD